ncbi:MAG: RluA family pseudouridine synthase [Candidatus Zixiibacteriota bacterium]
MVQVAVPLSRSKIQKLIRRKKIKVIGKGTKPNFILKGGEHIIVEIPDEPNITLEAEDIPLDIVYEDDYMLIVNKPAGMVVHPARGHRSGTLVNAVLAHTHKLSPVGGDTRPGIVHRLDKDTSGLLVVAKTESAHLKLSDDLAKKEIYRHYRAICWGHPDRHIGTIDAPIGHHPSDHLRMAVVEDGKKSVTHYTVRAYYDFLTDLSIQLDTGRTHQIRVHLDHIGHQILGDPTYAGRMERIGGISPMHRIFAKRLVDLTDRQMLHAEKLVLDHPITGEKIEARAELPADMAQILEILEKEKNKN